MKREGGSTTHFRERPAAQSRRFGCERSKRIAARFPDRLDHIARATIEAGSRLFKSSIEKSEGA